MNYRVCVFKYLEQKVMYLPDVNFYFSVKDDYDLKLGDYEISKEAMLAIAKENDPEEYEVFTNSSIEERMTKINTYNFEEIKEEILRGQFTLCLHPSRRCNLNCKYCFRESEYLGDEQLTFEVAKDAIDFLVDKYAPCASKYVVDLSGSGEPLLQINLIKQIVNYCKQKRDEVCKNIEVMFCSNLTLLTPEVAKYLDDEPAIILGTSIDGDQITNDSNRKYANNKGTYNDIIKGLKMFKHKKIGLAVTVTPLNQNVDLIYDHLYHLPNVDCISMKYIRCFDGSDYDFYNFNVDVLVKNYEKLCKRIIIEVNKGNIEYLKMIIRGGDYFGGILFNNIFKGYYKIFRCDAGKSRITVNNHGDIFACSVMYGKEDFRIGNIYKGIEKKLQSKYQIVSVENEKSCTECVIRRNCGGECYINAFLRNNNFFSPIQKMCELKVKLNYLGMAFLTYLKTKHEETFDSIVNYAFEVNNFETTNLEAWAVLSYLKRKGIIFDYCTIINRINEYNNPIEGIVKTINAFVDNVSFYQVNNLDEVFSLKTPMVIIQSSNNILALYEYYIFDYINCNEYVLNNMYFSKIIKDTYQLQKIITGTNCFIIV